MSQAATWGVQTAAPATPLEVSTRITDNLNALLSSNSGSARPSYAVAGTVWLDTDDSQIKIYDGTSDLTIAINAGAPSSATDTGSLGDVAWDADYFYICTATDTWKRVAVATW